MVPGGIDDKVTTIPVASTAGFQSYQSLLGLTVARNFSLQPYRITQPLGQTSFFLKAPSKVEVLVNGRALDRFDELLAAAAAVAPDHHLVDVDDVGELAAFLVRDGARALPAPSSRSMADSKCANSKPP